MSFSISCEMHFHAALLIISLGAGREDISSFFASQIRCARANWELCIVNLKLAALFVLKLDSIIDESIPEKSFEWNVFSFLKRAVSNV